MATAGVHIPETPHQRVEFAPPASLSRVLNQPLAEGSIEGGMPRTGHASSLLDKILIRAESNVFHTSAVYTKFVQWVESDFGVIQGTRGVAA